MLIIGITGGTGAGKTSALDSLEQLGALALDCDAIYHELLSDNKEMISELGAGFEGVLSEGIIDRKKLAEIVFADASALDKLNKITHKYVSQEIKKRVNQWELQGGEIVAIDAIALIESGASKECDIVVGITAPKEMRMNRIIARDEIPASQAEFRANAQKPDSFYEENCDHILHNTAPTIDEFKNECEKFFRNIIDEKKKERSENGK
jgi:dephospho-CoA kinase